MFGFRKKNVPADKGAPGEKPLSAAEISDDKFTVIPASYLPSERAQAVPAHRFPKKVVVLGGGAVVVLGGLFAVLYAVFLSPERSSAPEKTTLRTSVSPQASGVQPDETARVSEIAEQVISTQAFDANNILTGSLSVTVPATVAQQYGSGIGVTVLSEGDVSLPEEGTVLGGLYSVYPAGVTFEEPLSVELSVANIPEGYRPADVVPAYLRGVRWEEFPDYQVTVGGYSFVLEKVPSGPIAVIHRPAEEAPSAREELSFARLLPTTDTDQDGLTDAEEDLLGLESGAPDSDGDSYGDLEEIKNNYSPLAGEGAKLSSSGLFATYTNATYGYRVDYPAAWLADALDQTNKQLLFISSTEEFFEILIIENPLSTPIVDWFRGQSPSLANVELAVTVLDGRPAVWSPDGRTLYAGGTGLIYVVTYNSGTRGDINWPNIFEHFYGSFRFGTTVAGSADEPAAAP